MKKNYLIDYIAFTIKEDLKEIEEATALASRLSLNFEFKSLKNGMLGYKQALTYREIKILFDGNLNMGTHFIVSGKGIRLLKKLGLLEILLKNIYKEDYNITRIDLTLDVFEFNLLNKIILNTEIGNIKTRLRKKRIIEDTEIKNNQSSGKTIYFGSRTSNVYFRFYDKGKESKSDNDITRLEIELKKEAANQIYEELLLNPLNQETIAGLVNGILKNNINFIDKTSNTNISRCDIMEWWKTTINYDKTNIIKTGLNYEVSTIDENINWLNDSVARTLAKVYLADREEFNKIIERGKVKLDVLDKLEIQEYKEIKYENLQRR